MSFSMDDLALGFFGLLAETATALAALACRRVGRAAARPQPQPARAAAARALRGAPHAASTWKQDAVTPMHIELQRVVQRAEAMQAYDSRRGMHRAGCRPRARAIHDLVLTQDLDNYKHEHEQHSQTARALARPLASSNTCRSRVRHPHARLRACTCATRVCSSAGTANKPARVRVVFGRVSPRRPPAEQPAR